MKMVRGQEECNKSTSQSENTPTRLLHLLNSALACVPYTSEHITTYSALHWWRYDSSGPNSPSLRVQQVRAGQEKGEEVWKLEKIERPTCVAVLRITRKVKKSEKLASSTAWVKRRTNSEIRGILHPSKGKDMKWRWEENHQMRDYSAASGPTGWGTARYPPRRPVTMAGYIGLLTVYLPSLYKLVQARKADKPTSPQAMKDRRNRRVLNTRMRDSKGNAEGNEMDQYSSIQIHLDDWGSQPLTTGEERQSRTGGAEERTPE
ncbi:hypothetical protein B0H14DRAFT_2571400 [Mycena olivaceomarginata]|nr:hypothetical protein B0H14DRAFT_2571400 [Mycena olivaceomarginata]